MSVCAPYPEPLSISPRCDLLLPGSHFEAGGVEYGEARGPAAAPSRRTHYYAAAFPHALQSAFALVPNRVGGRLVLEQPVELLGVPGGGEQRPHSERMEAGGEEGGAG